MKVARIEHIKALSTADHLRSLTDAGRKRHQKDVSEVCNYALRVQSELSRLREQNAELVHRLNEWFTEKEFRNIDEMQGAWLATEELKRLAEQPTTEGESK